MKKMEDGSCILTGQEMEAIFCLISDIDADPREVVQSAIEFSWGERPEGKEIRRAFQLFLNELEVCYAESSSYNDDDLFPKNELVSHMETRKVMGNEN